MSSRKLEAWEIAETLADFYEESFGGKAKGRYQITRKLLKELTGRNILRQDFLDQITEHLYDLNLTLIDLAGDTFIVIPTKILAGYRKLTTIMVKSFIEKGYMEDGDNKARKELIQHEK
jgi:ribose 5-phosphate isomerase RpiB